MMDNKEVLLQGFTLFLHEKSSWITRSKILSTIVTQDKFAFIGDIKNKKSVKPRIS